MILLVPQCWNTSYWWFSCWNDWCFVLLLSPLLPSRLLSYILVQMDHHNYPDALQQLPQSPASVQIPNTRTIIMLRKILIFLCWLLHEPIGLLTWIINIAIATCSLSTTIRLNGRSFARYWRTTSWRVDDTIIENAADDNDDARDVINGSMKIRKMILIVCVFDDPLCISL